jgi:hypothetical protein
MHIGGIIRRVYWSWLPEKESVMSEQAPEAIEEARQAARQARRELVSRNAKARSIERAKDLWAAIRDETVSYVALCESRERGTEEDFRIDEHNHGVASDILREKFRAVTGYDPDEWELL